MARIRKPSGLLAFSSQILNRPIETAMVGGTILAFISHGELLFSWSLTPRCWLKIGLTCFVPYSVASWTASKAKLEALSLS